jgi:hypothetical protein
MEQRPSDADSRSASQFPDFCGTQRFITKGLGTVVRYSYDKRSGTVLPKRFSTATHIALLVSASYFQAQGVRQL